MNNHESLDKNIGGILKRISSVLMCIIAVVFVLALIGATKYEGDWFVIFLITDIVTCGVAFVGSYALYAFGVNTENIAAIKEHLTKAKVDSTENL